MTPTFETDTQREVWAAVQRLNGAWLRGELENLDEVLHPRMVMVPPGFSQRIEGAAACAEGYREFAREATVEAYEESGARVDVVGASAVASYRYDLTYRLGGAAYRDTGHDLYVFAYEGGRWQAIWRTLLPAQAPDAEAAPADAQ